LEATYQTLSPIPLVLELDQRKVELGDLLFHEPQLSGDNTISCARCHNLALGGTDQQKKPVGIHDLSGNLNTPTVFNSGFNFRLFWDGRASSLEEQIEGPIHTDFEMDSDWSEIIIKLNKISTYRNSFKQIYGDGITAENIKDAIATFERSLYTPNSRFDQFLRGDTTALSPQEKEGYDRFVAYGCVSCHQGVLLGGNMFQVFGVMDDYFRDRNQINPGDLGRFNVTGDMADRHVFKVPGLRNIVLTAPYFHDGSAPTLEQAIKVMAQYQLGRQLPQTDVDAITAFLQTLTGEYRGHPL
jgi:cytochrome c peroxidase